MNQLKNIRKKGKNNMINYLFLTIIMTQECVCI